MHTTLACSRVYDSPVAADYYRAVDQIEDSEDQPFYSENLLALLDVLQPDTLDEVQQKAVQALRAALLVLDMSCVRRQEQQLPNEDGLTI
jgi:hypothetical protein